MHETRATGMASGVGNVVRHRAAMIRLTRRNHFPTNIVPNMERPMGDRVALSKAGARESFLAAKRTGQD